MLVEFYDRENLGNSRNGDCFSKCDELLLLFEEFRSREPFFCELVGSNGFNLLIGLGNDVGCAQYSKSNGEPPYLMALAQPPLKEGKEEFHEFLTGGTPTPVENRYCISYYALTEIVSEFIESGDNSHQIDWKEI